MKKNQKVVDTEDISREIRETFHQSPSKKKLNLSFSWPLEMRRIGTSESIMYLSDKWGIVEGEKYKHVSESDCDVYISPSVQIRDEDGELLDLGEDWEDLDGKMPRHIAVLGKSLGIQVRLECPDSSANGLKKQLDFASATWGAAKSPETGETFLVLFSPREVLLIVTGDELDIERDGVVG